MFSENSSKIPWEQIVKISQKVLSPSLIILFSHIVTIHNTLNTMNTQTTNTAEATIMDPTSVLEGERIVTSPAAKLAKKVKITPIVANRLVRVCADGYFEFPNIEDCYPNLTPSELDICDDFCYSYWCDNNRYNENLVRKWIVKELKMPILAKKIDLCF